MAAAQRVAYFNGQFMPEREVLVPYRDLSSLRGYGAFDLTRTFHGRPFRLKEHVQRLYRSLKYLDIDCGIAFDDMMALSEETLDRNRHLLSDREDYWVGQRISAGVQAIGDEGWDHIGPNVIIECCPLPISKRAHLFRDGIKVVTPATPRTAAKALSPRAKMNQYLNIILAGNDVKRLDPQAWALMLDENGNLAEGEGNNIFLVIDGVLMTPRANNILPGISRATVIELAEKLDIEIREADLDLYDAAIAEEMFIASTSLCICPVSSFNGRRVGDGVPGPLTARLTQAYIDLAGCDLYNNICAGWNRFIMKRKITADGVAVPGAPFTSAIATEGRTIVHTSGFMARDPQTGAILHPGDAERQTLECFGKIEKVLVAAGGTLDDIVKMTVFLTDASNYEAMNRARRAKLAGIDYASSTVLTGLVAANALVEIECIAAIAPNRTVAS